MRQVMFNNKQARQFILIKQGLLGDYKFIGEKGVCDYIKQAGCIQFDPIDVCGKNAELVLQSRVDGFTKEMLYNLLYEDRKLIDYFDKNMSIFNTNEWQYFSRERTYYDQNNRSKDEINKVTDKIISIIESKGFVSSRDLKFNELVDWSWNPTSLSRAALESLYFQGELIIHHKKGTIKHYALANKHIPAETLYASDPNQTLEEHLEWRVLRRIGAVGLLWNRPSDAFLGMRGLKSNQRNGIFNKLIEVGKIIEIIVENISTTFYCLATDEPLIAEVLNNNKYIERTEFIAPLDNMIWDRKLIKEIFNFEYKWEIYTPLEERKYGYYVLPILHGDSFIGRIELANDKKLKQLVVKNIWLEDGIEQNDDLNESVNECIIRFTKFNNCESIRFMKILKEKIMDIINLTLRENGFILSEPEQI